MAYELIKRNANFKGKDFIDNTHTCVIDIDIEKIICYKKRDDKYFLIMLNIITLGLINLTYFFRYDYFVNFYYCVCDIKHPRSEYILIKNKTGKYILVDLNKKNYYITFPKFAEKNTKISIINEKLVLECNKPNDISDNLFENKNINSRRKSMSRRSKVYNLKDDLIFSFTYKNNNYEFDESLNKFKPVFFNLSGYQNSKIHDKFGDGIKSLTDYNYALNKYGLNEINTLKSTFIGFLIKQLLHPFYIYQIFAFVAWSLSGYTSYLFIIVVLILVVIIFNSYILYHNWSHIFSYEESKECQAVRNLSDFDKNERLIYDRKILNLSN